MVAETIDRALAGIGADDQKISLDELQRALGLQSAYLAKRFFSVLDLDGNGLLDRDELYRAVRVLESGSLGDRIGLLFRLHDADDDGYVFKIEVDRLIHIGMAENRLQLPPDIGSSLVDVLFDEVDQDFDGRITLPEFTAMFASHPEVVEQMCAADLGRLIGKFRSKTKHKTRRTGLFRWLAHQIEANATKWMVVGAYALVNVLLFVAAVEHYAEAGANVLVQLARGCGACLNFNGALILVPMMRRLITWLRKRPLARYVPMDEAVAFHRIVGHALFVFAVVHTICHLLNYVVVSVGGGSTVLENLLGTQAGLTGLFLMGAMLLIWVFAQDRIRRSGLFELFYLSHLAYFLWIALALFHGPVFWIWAGVPILGYVAERVLRMRQRSRPTEIKELGVLASGVTHVKLARPPGWNHQAGDYLFLRIPTIARHEWHPFTISSAPEQDEVDVHVRSAGNWTRSLHKLAQARKSATHAPQLLAQIDGPYGTPSAHIFNSKVAVVIGAGIGVTPFAAILQSLLIRQKREDIPPVNLQRVHFVWVSRDHNAFEWFAERLAELERRDQKALLRYHIYVTSARQGVQSGLLSLARKYLYAKTKSDFVTGLAARTQFGRPNWEELLTSVLREHAPTPIDVYVCGPMAVVRALRPVCRELGMSLRHEVF